MNQQERCLWLIKALLKDMPQYEDTPIQCTDRWIMVSTTRCGKNEISRDR